MDTHNAPSNAAERLAEIAKRIQACPPPDVYDGYDQCPCGTRQTWPCETTEAAWLARGLDITTEARRQLAALAPPLDRLPGATPHQRCFECHTEYATAEDLLRAFNDSRPGPNCPPARDASEVVFCPECMHDFAFAAAGGDR